MLQESERFTPDWGSTPDGHSWQPEAAAAAREKLVSEAAAETARNSIITAYLFETTTSEVIWTLSMCALAVRSTYGKFLLAVQAAELQFLHKFLHKD